MPPDELEMNPEFISDRKLVEDFARRIVETWGDTCAAAVFLPWSAGIPPPGVIIPTSRQGTLDEEQLRQTMQDKTIIVVGCTFKFQEEQAAASKLVEQLKAPHVCILAAHLLPPGNNYLRSMYDSLMEVHQEIGRLGVDDVLLDPEWEPARLKLRLRMAQHSWSVNQNLLQSMLQEEPQPPPPEEVEQLEATHRQLLWEDIPRELMPHFKAMTADLQESPQSAGEYILKQKMETQAGIVWEGKDKKDRKVAVKIIDKADVFTPGEVEGIYREFRFLAGFTRHPNIVRAVDCFHGPNKIYTVMEFAGKQNLAQYLSDLPGLRMNEQDATGCFHQLASALAHCHARDVSHRAVSLEHVVMKPEADGTHTPKMVDFRSAMVAKEGVTSVTVCGSLPCMSPEMLCGQAYMPKPADCWGVGVLLLEMAGGKGSFFLALGIDEQKAREQDSSQRPLMAEQIGNFFKKEGSHGAALSCMGGLQSTEIVEVLQGLLTPETDAETNEERAPLERFLNEETEKANEQKKEELASEPAS